MQCDISSGILQSRGTQWVTKTSQSFWAMVSWRQVNKTPGTILGVLHFFPYYLPNNSTRYIPISHTSQLIFRIEVTRPVSKPGLEQSNSKFCIFFTPSSKKTKYLSNQSSTETWHLHRPVTFLLITPK